MRQRLYAELDSKARRGTICYEKVRFNMEACYLVTNSCNAYRGTSLIRKCPPLYEHHKSLGIDLMSGPGGVPFLVSKVPLSGESE